MPYLISRSTTYFPNCCGTQYILHEPLFFLRETLFLSTRSIFPRFSWSVFKVASIKQMEEAKPLTNAAIALTEKKMGMTLDDIIKMSSKNAARPPRNQRISNRNPKFSSNYAQDKSSRMRRVMDIKSALRQGALAQKRSNFQANSFPLATQTARKAAVAPIGNGPVNRHMMVNKPRPKPVQRRAVNGSGFIEKQQHQGQIKPAASKQQQQQQQQPQTLDSRFASMKNQRTMETSQKNNVARRKASGLRIPPWQRARFGF